MGRRLVVSVFALMALGMLLLGQEPPVAGKAPAAADSRLESLLDRMDQVQKGMNTLRVTFVQTNTFRMLSQPQVMKGHLIVKKPDTALYEYVSPSKLFFLVKDGDLLVYNPAQKKVVVQDIRRHQTRIVRYLGISQPLKELQESFTVQWDGVENGIVHLNLIPSKLRMKRKIASLHFWVDSQTADLKGFEIVEAEGDRIRFDFSQWEKNPTLGEDAFKVSIPPGVKVHRQMLDLQEPFQR
jgi:outer membrane lipoprotein-sorting protein